MDAAAALAKRDSLAGLRDAAIVALASDAMLRVSEVTTLDVPGLEVELDGSGRLAICHSKTDQEGEGAVAIVGAPTVRRVRTWFTAAGIEAGAIFRRVRTGDVVGTGRWRSPGMLGRAARSGDVDPPRHPGLGRRFHTSSATRSSSSRGSDSGVCTTTGPLP